MAAPIIAVAGKMLLRAAVSKGAEAAAGDPGARKLVGVAAAIVVALPLAAIIALMAITSALAQVTNGASQDTIEITCDARKPSGLEDIPDGDVDTSKFSEEQIANATTIIGVVRSAHLVPPTEEGGATSSADTQTRAAVIALATAMQESGLRNLDYGDRDSVGLFQQRPGSAWGTVEQIMDPMYATTAFLYGAGTNPGLVDVEEWWTLDVTIAAQAVQRSGFPDAYAKHEALASTLVTELWEEAKPITTHPDLDRDDLLDPERGTSPLIPGGDAECGTFNGESPIWDGDYKSPGAWGGYSNGKIPTSALCLVPFATGYYARCDAVASLVALNRAYRADHGNKNLIINSAYRSYSQQVAIKTLYCNTGRCHLAAQPGTSNHGWAMAVDFGAFGSVGDYSSDNYKWMAVNGPAYGWVNPPHMAEGGKGPLEPWHWEFMGIPEGLGVDDESDDPAKDETSGKDTKK